MRQKFWNFLILYLIFIGSLFLTLNCITQEENSNNEIISPLEPEKSDFWILNYIHISGNWSATNSTYAWCSGGGTQGDPYIIENVTINGQFFDDCIRITSGSEYFMVRNCTLFNAQGTSSSAGLYIGSDNGIIMNNTVYNNKAVGIYANGENLTIFDNKVYGNDATGIFTMLNKFYNVCRNEVYGNYYSGIQLSLGDNSSVTGNTVYNNGGDGITILDGEYHNISNNILSYNDDYGIGLYADNCSITHNILNKNLKGCIYVSSFYKDNTFYNNTCIPIDPSEEVGTPSSPDDPTIPSGNIFLILTFLGIISILLIHKIKKNIIK